MAEVGGGGADRLAEVRWQRLAEVSVSAEKIFLKNSGKYLGDFIDKWLANYDDDFRDAATTTKRKGDEK